MRHGSANRTCRARETCRWRLARRHFARQHAEDGGAVMKRQENVAARVDVERTVVVPEVISEQSARSVRCQPFPDVGQKVIHTCIHMGKLHTGIAGGKLGHRRVHRFLFDGGKVAQNFDRRDSTCGVALQAAGLDQLARRHDAPEAQACLAGLPPVHGHAPADRGAQGHARRRQRLQARSVRQFGADGRCCAAVVTSSQSLRRSRCPKRCRTGKGKTGQKEDSRPHPVQPPRSRGIKTKSQGEGTRRSALR